MASRIKVDEVTNLAQSGAVAFPTGGANFSGNVAVTGNIDFSGDLLQNGSAFVTLPTQDASNFGSVLRSGVTSGNAYWDMRTLNNQEIAPGLYIYHIEETGLENISPRIGKFAVIR